MATDHDTQNPPEHQQSPPSTAPDTHSLSASLSHTEAQIVLLQYLIVFDLNIPSKATLRQYLIDAQIHPFATVNTDNLVVPKVWTKTARSERLLEAANQLEKLRTLLILQCIQSRAGA